MVRSLHITENKKVSFKCDGETMFLNEDEILYVIVTSHYLTIYTYEKEYTIREPLKDFEMKLSNRFARSGISYLINISKIDKITANDVYINGKQLPLYVD